MVDSKKYNGSTWEHSLRKLTTSTDTFTTLPADIYADGNNATVGISGNTVQNGTPTLDNPIMPQGCGDLETSGAKAGQYKIPISSANTTTPVYLGEVQTTRRIKKLVLTGEENTWTQSGVASNTFYFNMPGYLRRRINIAICSHYTSQANINGGAEMQDGNVSFYANVGQPLEYFYVRDSNFATVADLKSYLAAQYAAGTPVTVWYVLATEETAVVNEPIRKIGDYADTVSDITVPTITGKDSFDVQTTLKPSEVSLSYTGWHDAEVKEWDGSQWD